MLKRYGIWLVLLFAALVRIMFYSGHIFSDDSYYVKVAFDFLNGGDISYLGYPVMQNRIAQIFSTYLSFRLFGSNEITSMIFPFFCSLGSIFIVYKFALKLYEENKNVALLSAFLMAILPTDIIFATISFADLQASFFFYLSLYLLYSSVEKESYSFAILAGLFAVTALFFKSIIMTGFVLLIVIAGYGLISRKFRIRNIVIYFLMIGFGLLLESWFNSIFFSDALRRLHIMEHNYAFSWYDFYPQSLGEGSEPGLSAYFLFLAKNLKYIFLRRFYLFLPLLALLPAIFNLISGKWKLISIWYIGLILLFLFFSTSLNSYRPMSLEQSWYLFPIFIPVVLIVGEYLSRFSWKFSRVILVFLLFFSLYMSYEYRGYFDVESKAEFKEYISGIDGKQIFTDHHTKYGVDLIRGYRDYQNVKLLDKLTTHAKQGDIVIISKKKLDELKLQGFDYEFDNFNNSPEKYKFGEFEVFELTN